MLVIAILPLLITLRMHQMPVALEVSEAVRVAQLIETDHAVVLLDVVQNGLILVKSHDVGGGISFWMKGNVNINVAGL